ncbi:hypothetical protein [[Flexibacter] sp. ATCC 35208]|uniref:hypothetical protein n=1 Tax=[Flexibacter] sp. ATCC 35208 TaxID=1936242 RepID=UPI0009CEAB98|nr:hypothetical protein [[Flexibacter] sp. ATCC 35208]OMP78207.1 hypothetical protein BW716_15645 [[Flexibacter] sp. ATCC 35208]
MNIAERLVAPTPPFFQKVRNVGLVLLAISGTIAGLPVMVPAVLTQIAGYLAVAGTVMSGISQATVDGGNMVKSR